MLTLLLAVVHSQARNPNFRPFDLYGMVFMLDAISISLGLMVLGTYLKG